MEILLNLKIHSYSKSVPNKTGKLGYNNQTAKQNKTNREKITRSFSTAHIYGDVNVNLLFVSITLVIPIALEGNGYRDNRNTFAFPCVCENENTRHTCWRAGSNLFPNYDLLVASKNV